jgi:hypothetical protein
MRTMAMARQYRSVRYYICADDQLKWRLPDALHRDLASGRLALHQFANAKLRVLEVFLGGSRYAPQVLNTKGSIYAFDEEGRLAVHSAVDAMGNVIEGRKQRRVGLNVIDIGPVVRHRKWTAKNVWRTTPALVRAAASDLAAPSTGKIKTLKR